MNEALALEKAKEFTNDEINEIAEWMNTLTLEQLFFLKSSYEAFVAMQTLPMESSYVH